MIRLILAAVSIALCGCHSDNASPFVHGGRNAPSRWGSTKVAKRSASRPATTTAEYGGSSGYAGGIDRSGAAAPATSPSAGVNAQPAAQVQQPMTSTAGDVPADAAAGGAGRPAPSQPGTPRTP